MSLTILMTNIVLVGRSGTEVVTEQLADALRRRGHRPILFTPWLGPLAEQMRQRGHVVVSRPDALPFSPDIIHAHHTGPAMAALAAHPGVPALFVCHSGTAPFDTAPPHPRVRRLFAVDEHCRGRLLAEGASQGSVSLLPNAVDLTRIPPRAAPLPHRPLRALALTKHAAHLPALRQACGAAGLTLEELGFGVGRVTDAPEAAFAAADLVFATARTALEAAAAGAGVVVCDARGCAGFLTRERAEAWLPWNLGAGVLKDPPDAATIAAAIAEWSAEEAVAASALVREQCGLEATLDRLEAIYAELLATPPAGELAAEAAATGAFIAGWVPHFDQRAPWRGMADSVAAPALPISPEAHAIQGVMLPMLSALQSEASAVRSQLDLLALHLTAAEAETRAMPGNLLPMLQVLQAELAAETRAMPGNLLPVLQVLQAELATVRGQLDGIAARRSLGRRAWDALRAIWRRTVPYAIRAPLHRLRHRGSAPGAA